LDGAPARPGPSSLNQMYIQHFDHFDRQVQYCKDRPWRAKTLVAVSGGVADGRKKRRSVYDKTPQRYAEDNRTQHLIVDRDRSEA